MISNLTEHQKWGHDQLANDLAEHLAKNTDRIIWTDMQLGPSGSPRPDVYSIPKSYSGFRPLAYECKVSVSDFRSDITKGKWQSYLRYASGVIFAVPKGLISKDDLPKGCGLIVRSASGWRMVKGPTLNSIANDLPKDFWIKLVIDGVDRSKRIQLKAGVNEYRVQREISKKYGEDLAMALAKKDQAQNSLEYRTKEIQKTLGDIDVIRHAERQKEMIASDKEDIQRLHHELCECLCIPVNSNSWEIRAALKKQKKLLGKDGQLSECQTALRNALSSMERQVGELKILSSQISEGAKA